MKLAFTTFKRCCAVMSLAAAVFLQASSAHAVDPKMYFTGFDNNTIYRANTDGTSLETLINSGLNQPSGIDIDVDGGKIYWGEYGSGDVKRANIDGSSVETIYNGSSQVLGVALDLDSGKVYWSERFDDRIRRADLDGSNVEDFITSADGPAGIFFDFDGGKIYWAAFDGSSIRKANLDGTAVETVVSGLVTPADVFLDTTNSKLYWTEPNAFPTGLIRRSDVDGSNIETVVTSGYAPGIEIDISAGHLYISDRDSAKIQRSDLDGSNLGDLVTGLIGPWDVVLDGVASEPEINVLGNSVSIVDGDVTPSSADHTDFGSISIVGSAVIITFTVSNVGTDTLNLTGDPIVVIGGANADDFYLDVDVDPADSVATGHTTIFSVVFNPSATGLREASISIANDDADENPYTFSIQGTGLADYDEDGDPDVTDPDDDDDGLTDLEEADLGTDPYNSDSDHDGVDDHQEVADNTSPTDSGSSLEHFGQTICAEWNGFLGFMDQIFEHRNVSSSAINVELQLYDIFGVSQSERNFSLGAGRQLDVVINDLPGFVGDSYGLVCSTITSGPADSLDGQLSYYQLSSAGDTFDIAWSLPVVANREGNQCMTYNTFYPTRSLAEISNFAGGYIQVSNASESAVIGDLIFYSENGSEIRTVELELDPKERRDVDTHSIGANRTGLVCWIPDGSDAVTVRQNRYYLDGPDAGSELVAQSSSPAKRGIGDLLAVPFDVDSRLSVLEVSNVLDHAVEVEIDIYSEDGTSLLPSSVSVRAVPATVTLELAPYSTRHLILNDYLDSGEGNAVIDADLSASVIVSLYEYGVDEEGGLQFAHSAQPTEGPGSVLRSSYNNFLGGCSMRLGNKTSDTQSAEVTMTRYDGTIVPALGAFEVTVPSYGSIQVDLCSNETQQAYGQVVVVPENGGALNGEIVRTNSSGTYEFGVGFRSTNQDD